MATQDEILVMIRKADSAGNVEDAKRLTQMYDEAGQSQGPEINNVAEGIRTVAKGATFGFADEIEAKVRTGQSVQDQVTTSMSYKDAYKALKQLPIAGRTPEQQAQAQQLTSVLKGEKQQKADVQEGKYKGVRDDLRASNAEFARQNPKTAMALEMAGGIATPVAGLGALKGASTLAKVAGGAAQGAGFGALYGAGNAKEMKDVAGDAMTQGALGGLTGGALSGLGAVIAPRVSKLTQKYMKNSDLTYGQMGGNLATKSEQKLGAVVTGVKRGRGNATKGWNRTVAEEVLAPFGKTLPKDIPKDNNAIARHIRGVVNEAYDEAFTGMKVNLTPGLKQEFSEIIAKSNLKGKALQNLKRELKDITTDINNSKQGLDGRMVKDVYSQIKDRVGAFRKSTDIAESPLEDALKQAQKAFKNNVVKQNPIKGKKWLDTDAGFGRVAQFQEATAKGNKKGFFTPDQLRKSTTTGLDRRGKIISNAEQKDYFQQMAKEAEDLLGDTVGDSGTAGNFIFNSAVAGAINPLMLIPYVGAEVAYSPAVLKFANNYIRNGGSREGLRQAIQKYAGTATSGLLTLQD